MYCCSPFRENPPFRQQTARQLQEATAYRFHGYHLEKFIFNTSNSLRNRTPILISSSGACENMGAFNAPLNTFHLIISVILDKGVKSEKLQIASPDPVIFVG